MSTLVLETTQTFALRKGVDNGMIMRRILTVTLMHSRSCCTSWMLKSARLSVPKCNTIGPTKPTPEMEIVRVAYQKLNLSHRPFLATFSAQPSISSDSQQWLAVDSKAKPEKH